MDLNDKMGKIDSLNLIDVNTYLGEFPYPSYSLDGKKFTDAIFYILQHSDTENMGKFIDQLEKRAFAEEASKKHYAMMKDRILMENKQNQIYGTQLAPRKNAQGFITDDYFVWTLQNPQNVDSLRKEMGFTSTVAEYAKSNQAEYHPNEQIK